MSWPGLHDIFREHVAGEPEEHGRQRCIRCRVLLSDGRTGAPPLYAPGKLVAVSESRMVRKTTTPGEYPPCTPEPFFEGEI